MSAEHVSWVYKFSPASGAVFQIHHAIADSVNDQHDHEFWMRLDKLATKARVNKGTARRAIVWLLDRGLLELGDGEVRKGASTSVLYRFLMPDDLPVVFDSRARKERVQGARGARPRARVVREEGAHTARSGRAYGAPLIEPKEEPKPDPKVEPKTETAADALVVAQAEPDPFDAFWSVYPRKIAKEQARKAFATALRKTSAESLLLGARRYRDDPNRVDQFTKHPATWLNGGCWDDEPLAPRRADKRDKGADGSEGNLAELREMMGYGRD